MIMENIYLNRHYLKKDDVKKYFTVLEDSKDYPRLKNKYKNVLPFYSIKQKLIYLFADKIISSHPMKRY